MIRDAEYMAFQIDELNHLLLSLSFFLFLILSLTNRNILSLGFS